MVRQEGIRRKRRVRGREALIEKRESRKREEEEEGGKERACHEEVHGREVYEG